MSEFVLVGKVERFGVEPDGNSSRFSTILAESHHYARLRIQELEEEVASYEAMKGGVAVRIADLERENSILSLKARVVDRLPLCPDHRDKVAGKPCLQCEVERLTRQRNRAWAGLSAVGQCLPGWKPTKHMGTEDAEEYREFVARMNAIDAEAAKGHGGE